MRSQGRFQLLRLVVMRGLICRLYRLYYRIEGIRSELEVSQATLLAHHMYSINLSQLAIDMQQLRIADSESATRTVVPSSSYPASGMHLLYVSRIFFLLTILLQPLWLFRLPR